MTNDDDQRGQVVEAFLEACPDPKMADVEKWCRAHPRQRDAIIATATEMMEIALLAGRGKEADDGQTAAGRTRNATKRSAVRINRLRGRERDEEAC